MKKIIGALREVRLLDVILVLFATLFVYAAVNKLITFDEFKVQISKSPLIMGHGWWISWAVPVAEISISAMLFIPRLQQIGLYAAFFLMFTFTLYIAFMLLYVPNLPCSCGGILNRMGWKEHLIFNTGFTLLGIIGLILLNKQKKAQSVSLEDHKAS